MTAFQAYGLAVGLAIAAILALAAVRATRAMRRWLDQLEMEDEWAAREVDEYALRAAEVVARPSVTSSREKVQPNQ